MEGPLQDLGNGPCQRRLANTWRPYEAQDRGACIPASQAANSKVLNNALLNLQRQICDLVNITCLATRNWVMRS